MSENYLPGLDRKQLNDYAKETHGVRFPAAMPDDEVRAKLALLDQVGPSAPAPEVHHRLGGATKHARMIINIQPQDKPGGDRDVFVAVNGVGYLIKRGKNVSVPAPVVEVLQHAIETIYDQVHDNQGRVIDLRKREALSYPFSVLGYDTESEVVAGDEAA